MTLRHRTMLVLLIGLALFLTALHLVVSTTVMNGFKELEARRARLDVHRAKAALSNDFAVIEDKLGDWAIWDDMYQFADDKNDNFIKSNLSDTPFRTMHLDFLVVCNVRGELVWGGGFDREREQRRGLTDAERNDLVAIARRIAPARDHGKMAGLTFVAGKPMMVAARAILKSDFTGPTRGAAVFCRSMNSAELARLSRTTQLDLSFRGVADPAVPADWSRARAPRGDSDDTELGEPTDEVLTGYALLRNTEGEPMMVLAVDVPRDVVRQGRAILAYVFAGTTAVWLLLAVVIFIFLEKTILRRLARMSGDALRVGDSANLSERIHVEGADELSRLGERLNEMLTKAENTQKELREARDAAESAANAKSEFLACMSHEIRTPMNGVLGMTELALQSPLPPETRSLIDTAHASAVSLLDVLNEILDYSRVGAGKLILESTEFDVRAVVREVMALLAFRARAKGLDFTHRVDESVPRRVKGDPHRLRQILMNLVSNAVKFTHRGSVSISVRCSERTAGEATLDLEVADTGIGIPYDRQQAVFEAFQQASASTARQYGGTGLGLAICAHLAKLMGGAITVDSAPGRGSTFCAHVRLGVAGELSRADRALISNPELAAAAAPEAAPEPSLSVLVVDDNSVNRLVARKMLERLGHRVVTVDDGRQAVAAAEDAHLQLILMDVQMPVMDGLEATRLIRERERNGGRRVAIIMLTAQAMSGDREKCLEAGADGYVSKPIRASDLAGEIRRVLLERRIPAEK